MSDTPETPSQPDDSERDDSERDDAERAQARRALPVLFSVVIVDLIGFGIAIPVLPFLAREYGASGVELGLILTGYAGAQFLFAPIWGRLSDRIGRRRVMLCTVAGTAAALLWLGLAQSLVAMFAARFLAGGFAANISVAAAYVTDVTDEAERTRWMGLLGACFGVGFVLGPALGGLLSHWGYAAPMLGAAGLAAVNWVYAFFVLREPARHASEAPRATRRETLADPVVRLICLLNLAFSTAVVQLETVFAFFMADRFGYDAMDVAWIFIGMAVLMGGIQGGGMKALAARFSERTLARGGSLLLAAAIAMVPFSTTIAVLLLPLAFSAIGRAVLQPSLMSLVSLEARPEHRGVVLGTFQSAASLGRVLGPVAAGLLYDTKMGAPFWFASLLLVVVFVAASGLRQRDAGVADAATSLG
ncbi:MAG: MFS transporter [Deltaproteobacteria bacterium]|nr:MFS transporter [Deltaproteobacteria bacterium]MBW2448090.1 MFS transporter [Deltaproteobacteria bacterium]